jgi:hypothetical protein
MASVESVQQTLHDVTDEILRLLDEPTTGTRTG